MNTYKIKCDICGSVNEVPSYADWDCHNCGQVYAYDEGHQICLTDAQWAVLRSKSRWIPVSERAPDASVQHGYCLVSDGINVGTANYTVDKFGGGRFWLIESRDEWHPTHWMTLPEPPEVK